MVERRRNSEREHRITYEAVVDCYDEVERAMGWYYYLERKLAFPFLAMCDRVRTTSPLRKGERVEVVALATEEDCMAEAVVLIKFADRRLGVPLAQLKPIKAGPATMEAVEDWRYWVKMGYGF